MTKWLMPALLLVLACTTVSQKSRRDAELHRTLAEQSLASGDARGALSEVEKSLELDPTNADTHNLHGLLLHLSFGRPEEAITAYRKALEIAPEDSRVKVNLGAALTALDRCKEAIPYLEQARADMLYREPYLAENNLGWCRFKLGDAEGALAHLQRSVTLNRKFCLGFRNLAQVYESQGRTGDARASLERYVKACPEVPDGYYQMGVFLLKQSELPAARDMFLACKSKAGESDLAEECGKQASMIP